ncbi:uncharacterized protein LOC143549922 [Bidens hawaiensis]|uniref:uncharacterized protein LOC143549922 n=1 Tax=Bidens hawaiensis TaxID=980011 RepID=UPI00404ADE3D
MAASYYLPDDIWSFIITLLATSANGATDLVRFAATCRKFNSLCRDTEVLKLVNFQRISVNDYGAHCHREGLLFLCARAENPAAQSMLGKALLQNDIFFWRVILEHDEPLDGVLSHRRLVRSFISDASDDDISTMRMPLYSYVIAVLDDRWACYSGLLLTIANMCSYYLEKRVNPVDDVFVSPLDRVNRALAVLKPPPSRAHRGQLLRLYDEWIWAGDHI